MSLDDQLLRLLACPIDKEALLYFPDDGVLYNPRLRRSYRVETGITESGPHRVARVRILEVAGWGVES